MNEDTPRTLAETQALLRRLITAPEGVRPALAEEGGPEGRSLSALIRDGALLSAVDRLEVYANAYFARILEVLRSDYPALDAAIGEARFHHLVAGYLAAHPPTRFSLRHAGEELPSFVAGHAAAGPLRDEFPWAADLAALEWAIVDAFDARDVPHVTREELARIPPGAWADLRFALDPSARIVRMGWPAQRLREAFDGRSPLPVIERADTAALVWRRDERVFHRPLEPLEASCLGLLSEGVPFGGVCGRVSAEAGEAEAPARALALLSGWVAGGLLSATTSVPA